VFIVIVAGTATVMAATTMMLDPNIEAAQLSRWRPP